MQAIQSNKIVRLQKVAAFFTSRSIAAPPAGLADKMAALTTAISNAQEAARIQVDATDYLARQSKTVRQLRQSLHDDHLIPLYHSAVALDKEIPNVLDHFQIPKMTLRSSVYIGRLKAVVGRATEFQEQFISHGAPVDFVATLAAAIANYTSAVTTRQTSMQTRVKAREDMVVSIAAGDAAVRHLNAMVIRIYANDPATIVAWKQACHVDRVGSRQKSTVSVSNSSTATPEARAA